jgi:hypothetical protein
MVMEVLHHARKVPSLPLSRDMNVRDVAAARKACGVSWTALFLRAYGLVSQKHPELRRAWMRWPYQHFYEHPTSEAAILIEREWQGEQAVLGAKIRSPEHKTLRELDELLRYYRETPVWEVSSYRQALRLGRLPRFLRRFTLWHTLYLSGYTRAKRCGTFMMSSLGNLGVEQHHPLTPLTTYFSYGPIAATGDVTAKIIYDHRVLDGRTVGRALVDLDDILQTVILKELREFGMLPTSSAA